MGRLKRLYFRLRFHFPSKLPRGAEEFQQFCNSIFELYSLPKSDSYYHSIAVMIQHLEPTTISKPKAWFYASIYNAQAREVAFYKIQELQKKAKIEAEAAPSIDEKVVPH